MAPSFMILRSLTLLAAASFSLAKPLSTSPHAPYQRNGNPMNLAPIHIPDTEPHNLINNSYIVMFKDGVHPSAFDEHFTFLSLMHDKSPLDSIDNGLKHIWNDHIKGYAGRFSAETIDFIRSLPEVDYIEQDQIVYAYKTQRGSPWGLARVSHRAKLSFSTFQRYEYEEIAGEGVDVYVVDTGVYIDHEEFEGRARWGKTVPQNDEDIDGNGHGTHCAGTIASKKYGVAKNANIIAVKVLGTNGSGTMSDVVQGVTWAATDARKTRVAAEAELKKTGKTRYKGSVANMSLGGGKSRALDDAVNRAVGTGLHFAVAAGNDNRDACDYSPAAAERAVTVGASTITDERAYFSNYGKCVDIFAPGLNILSTWNSGPGSVNTISGTSMASPHIAGLLAYLISIYPSTTFNPTPEKGFLPPVLGIVPVESARNVYTFAYDFLPSWMTRILPPPSFFNDAITVAPVPTIPVLTPDLLKKALVKLATEGVLVGSQLPSGTPNLLAFNNATGPDGRSWVNDDFWANL